MEGDANGAKNPANISPFANGRISLASVGIPPAPVQHIPRKRLFELLDARRAVTTIVGAAGFGKSTLISGWLANSRSAGNVAWLGLEEIQDDAFLFLAQLIAAIRASQPSLCDIALALLDQMPAARPRAVLTSILNDLSAQGENWTIVLDDYPSAAVTIDELIGSAGDKLPDNISLIIASRGEVSLPMARWRVRQRVTEIGIDDLRFTPAETRNYILSAMNVPLDDESIELLDQNCEGWVAGLQLAALWLQRRGRDAAVSEMDLIAFDGQHRFVSDYLAVEILGDLDQETRRFLLATSVVDRFTAPLCDALLESTSSAATLAALRHRGLFVIALDDHNNWYRYHHLFRDFLRAQLDEDEAARIHRRVSVWFERAGHIGEAIRHAQLSGDLDRALRLIKSNVDAALSGGEFHELFVWLDRLPDTVLREDAELSGFKAWLLYMKGRLGEAEACSEAVTMASEPSADAHSGPLNAFKAFLHLNRGRSQDAAAAARAAVDSLAGSGSFFSGLALLLLGVAERVSGLHEKAIDTLWSTVRFAEMHGNQIVRLEAMSELIPMMFASGKLRDAARLCEEAIADAVKEKRHLRTTGLLHLRLGQILYEMNELDRAKSVLDYGLELCEKLGTVNYRYIGKRHLARLAFAKGNHREARELLAEAAQVADRAEHPRQRRMIDAVAAGFLLSEGHLQAASSLMSYVNEWAHETSDFEQIVHIRLMLALDRPRVADATLVRMEQAARRDHRLGSLFTILLLRSLSCEGRGEKMAAARLAIEALALGGPAGYVRSLLDLGPAIAVVLRRIETQSMHAQDYLRLFEPAEDQDAATPMGPLTGTENNILQLVALGMSNRDIARKLNITVGTTKWHIHHIYQKLDAPSRTAAVHRAREMRLLQD